MISYREGKAAVCSGVVLPVERQGTFVLENGMGRG